MHGEHHVNNNTQTRSCRSVAPSVVHMATDRADVAGLGVGTVQRGGGADASGARCGDVVIIGRTNGGVRPVDAFRVTTGPEVVTAGVRLPL